MICFMAATTQILPVQKINNPQIVHRATDIAFRDLLERLQWSEQGPGCLIANSLISCMLTELLSTH